MPWKPDIVEPWGVFRAGRLDGGALFRGGPARLVDRLIISLPCTTRLSVDFLRSRVSISVNHGQCLSCQYWSRESRMTELTLLIGREVDDISNSYIDDSQESLILLLELLLVKDLNCQDAVLRNTPSIISVGMLNPP